MPIKVAIADDHHLIADGVRNMLQYASEIDIIDAYTNGDDLLHGLRNRQPDVLLLDINMPGRTGDELASIISTVYPDIKIIALTNLDNIYYIKSMLQHRVSGYLLKDIAKAELLIAIKMVAEGKQYFDKIVYQRMEEDEKERKQLEANAAILSEREKEILILFAQNLNTIEIAEKLRISRRTVEHHRESIFVKFDVKGTLAMVKKGEKLGLINEDMFPF